MKDQDIEDRAKEFVYDPRKFKSKDGSYPPATVKAISQNSYIAAMKEERERGKRFAVWVIKNNLTFITDLSFITDDIYNSFLAEEKELTT
jgi:phenolic acid decarboxylase